MFLCYGLCYVLCYTLYYVLCLNRMSRLELDNGDHYAKDEFPYGYVAAGLAWYGGFYFQ